MPVFMNNIVMEKEKRLIQIMKINGLQMKYYWFVNFICNLVFYLVQASIYFLFGKHAAKLTFFINTNPMLLILTLFGWGLCQISLAFTYSNFFDK